MSNLFRACAGVASVAARQAATTATTAGFVTGGSVSLVPFARAVYRSRRARLPRSARATPLWIASLGAGGPVRPGRGRAVPRRRRAARRLLARSLLEAHHEG